jgi:Cu(I)/Ag(I) efflux system protein CusF
MKQLLIIALLALALPLAGQGIAGNHQSAGSTTEAAPMSSGEVRKIDLETKKITLRHGPIANLGMPAMTMVFQVSDPAMLEQVKAGDKIRFTADKNDGAYRITRIEK